MSMRSAGVSTSLVAAADTFVEEVKNEVATIAAAAPVGSPEAAEAAAAATRGGHHDGLGPVVVVSQTLAPTPRPSPAPSPASHTGADAHRRKPDGGARAGADGRAPQGDARAHRHAGGARRSQRPQARRPQGPQ